MNPSKREQEGKVSSGTTGGGSGVGRSGACSFMIAGYVGGGAGGGAGGSARVTIAFPDNTVQNTWLQVTVLANAATGLSANDVFYFGNAIGDVGVGNTTGATGRIRVNATDTGAVRTNQSTLPNSAPVTNIYDINRDGRVNATDTGLVRSNQQTLGIVAPITVPSARGSLARGSASPAVAKNDSPSKDTTNDDADLGSLDEHFASFWKNI